MRFKRLICAFLAGAPIAMFAFSTGPPTKRTGAPIDGGLNCSVCHFTFAPANSDPKGSVSIDVLNYAPGVKQTIKVTVKHPDAIRWGFQLTARTASDQTKPAGTLAINDLVRVRCDSTPAHDTPCNGALEFAEHNNAPFTDPGVGTYTFNVDWTPPATDVGPVVFYAAGNAANGDHNLTGDHIYTTSTTVQVDAASVCTGTLKPAITSVANAASFQTTLAANSMVTIFGSGFAPASVTRAAGAADFLNNAFPKQLACIAVEIDGKRAPISYVQGNQINAQVPATTSTGPVSVKVLLNPDLPAQVASNAGTVQLQSTAAGLFTFDGKSVAAQIAGSSDIVADPSLVPGARAAKPGELVTLYGTGFGPTNPAVAPGDIATAQATVTTPITVTIGGVTLSASDVLYAGLSPGSISGLYQINARIPASLADGNATVVIQSGGTSTQSGTTIPIKH